MSVGRLVLAYHGCDITLRDDLVHRRIATIRASKNTYDWLGTGAYFFEDDAQRAKKFATRASENPEKRFTATPIATPAVVGAVLCLNNLLDLQTQAGLYELATACEFYELKRKAEGKTIPQNTRPAEPETTVLLRAYDREVINFLHEYREAARVPGDDGEPVPLTPYDAVRSAFPDGGDPVGRSSFRADGHVQIAVRRPQCILAWFLAPGDKLLSEDQLSAAREQLETKVAAYPKPRQRAS